MTRVIHTADTHLGYRQYHAPERRADFRRAFERVIEDAVADDVDAVVHAGDLYHDRRPGLRDILETIDLLRDLRAADIPFLAVVGNHEGTRDAQWLDLFETLGLATRLDETPTVVGDAAFYGLDYVPPARRDDLDYAFEPSDADAAALVAHGLFEPFAHADWDTGAVLTQSPVDFDAVLLGDNHDPGRETVDGTLVTYCGSTERTSAEEREARGYNLVTFADGVDLSRRGIETRPFVFVDVDLAPGEGADRVRRRLAEADLEDAVVIVTVEGEGESFAPADVEAVGEEAGALVTRVNDRRELEDDAAEEVHFADPDRAVEDRVRELGLSEAAREIDRTVRDPDAVPDSRVRDVVADRVAEVVDDPAAFEPADGDEPGDGDPDPGGPGDDGQDDDDAAPESATAAEDDEPGDGDAADADDPAGESGDDGQQVTMEDYL